MTEEQRLLRDIRRIAFDQTLMGMYGATAYEVRRTQRDFTLALERARQSGISLSDILAAIGYGAAEAAA